MAAHCDVCTNVRLLPNLCHMSPQALGSTRTIIRSVEVSGAVFKACVNDRHKTFVFLSQ